MNTTMQQKQSNTDVEEKFNSNSNSELIKKTDVENSPFQVVTTEQGSFGTMGQYRLTEVFENENEAIEEMKTITWNKIVQVMMVLIDLEHKTKINGE